MIEVQDLVKTYGPVNAVDGISFRIETGEVVGLLGPNGAGKSTTIRILTTFLAPSSGKASVAGFDVTEKPLEVRKKLGYLPENAPLYEEMRVRDYLSFVMQARGIPSGERKQAMDRIVERTGISGVIKKSVSELSKGYRQRVGLAQAMVHDPEILILDEPTSGLDPNQIVEIRNLVREIGLTRTVILSTHILAEVEATCDRVIIVNRGRIALDGKISDLAKARADHYRVRSGAPRDKALAALRSVAGVLDAELSGDAGADDRIFVVRTNGKNDAGSLIFGAFCSAGLELSEIYPIRRTLENIFQDLTKEH